MGWQTVLWDSKTYRFAHRLEPMPSQKQTLHRSVALDRVAWHLAVLNQSPQQVSAQLAIQYCHLHIRLLLMY